MSYPTIITSMLVTSQTLLSASEQQYLTIDAKRLFFLFVALFFQKCAFCHLITERYPWSMVGYDISWHD